MKKWIGLLALTIALGLWVCCSAMADIKPIPLDMLELRLHNMKERGVALRDGMTLEDLYNERTPLYEKYADIVIEEKNTVLEDMVEAIEKALKEENLL